MDYGIFLILHLVNNPNKLYERTSLFTNDVKLGVYSTKPLNMQSFSHIFYILSLIELCTMLSKAQIDYMFALRHFLEGTLTKLPQRLD